MVNSEAHIHRWGLRVRGCGRLKGKKVIVKPIRGASISVHEVGASTLHSRILAKD